jgi:DNA-binding transcriptional regulator YhcF (GntR family)
MSTDCASDDQAIRQRLPFRKARTRKYANLTHTSPATAQRGLANLVEQGILRVEGAGRSVRYALKGRD